MEEPIEEQLSSLLRRPLLTVEEERYLARQMRLGGSEGAEARIRLIEGNIRLVNSIAHSFNRQEYVSDLIAEGMIGLVRAVDGFDPDKGFRLSTYATPSIRKAISKSLANFHNNRNVARLPDYAVWALRQLRQLIEESPQLLGDIETLATRMGTTRETTVLLLFAHHGGLTALSLDVPVTGDSSTSFLEVVPELKVEDASVELVGILLEHLTEREAKIFRLHYLEGELLVEIAAKMNISITGLGRIMSRAKDKLRSKYPTLTELILDS